MSLLVEESYLCFNGIAAEVNRLSFLLSVIMFTVMGNVRNGMATV